MVKYPAGLSNANVYRNKEGIIYHKPGCGAATRKVSLEIKNKDTMKKKVISLLAAVITGAMLISGCGGSADQGNDSSAEQAAEEDTQEKEAETAENTEETENTEESANWDFWKEYTESVGKSNTDLDFLSLGLGMPLKWEDLIPHISEIDVSGRLPDTMDSVDLTAEDLLTTEYVIYSNYPTVTIEGCKLDFNPGLSDEDRRTVPLGECVSKGQFVLSTSEYDIRNFFGIPEEAKPDDIENSNEEYWLLTALMEKYGQPDYVGDYQFGPALYWERDGYYFGCMLFYVPSANTMQVTNAFYVPASAWEWFNNDYLVSCGWEPLVPYTAK